MKRNDRIMESFSLQRVVSRSLAVLLVACCVFLAAGVRCAAQSGNQGDLVLVVHDNSGAIIPDAALVVRDKSTNVTRNAITLKGGTYTFSGLDAGDYTLSVSKPGFKDAVYDTVTIQASRVTDLSVPLIVGAVSEKVEVTTQASTLIESSSNVIGTTIDLKQIEDLPIFDRDPTQLSAFVAGYNSAGFWDNNQHQSEITTMDGVVANSSRFKAGGAIASGSTPVTPRLQNTQEFTVQTSGLTASQGYGQATMQGVLSTRRGSNAYHGRAFFDLQNSSLNANSWNNDFFGVPKALSHKEDSGGSVGGFIIKNKLFFFASFEADVIPGKGTGTDAFLTPSMQQGNYVFQNQMGNSQTVNLFQLAGAAGLQSTMDTGVAAEIAKINAALPLGTPENVGGASTYEDQNVQNLAFLEPNNQYSYYPVFRVDYTLRKNLSIDAVLSETNINDPTDDFPSFPGPNFSYQQDGFRSHNYVAGIGVNWSISPTLLNEFQGGYLYDYGVQNPKSSGLEETHNLNFWNGPWGLNTETGAASGEFFYSTISTLFPQVSFNDNLLWQKGRHNFTFGVSFYREQDHYWNPPLGYTNVVFGMGGGDPGLQVFSPTNPALQIPGSNGQPIASPTQYAEMQSYYAILTGDLLVAAGSHPIDPRTHQYLPFGGVELDELQRATGLYFQDSWRPFTNLTINYGLRWDFTGDDHDLGSIYYSPTSAGLWGPTGVNNAFNPGSFQGQADPSYIAREHAYAPWDVSPQPNVGFAWSPTGKRGGFLDKLLGTSATVVRGGFSVRRYTPQYQDYWGYASDFGSLFYQNFSLNAANAPSTGFYTAGTEHYANFLNGTFPTNYLVNPTSYQSTFTEASQFEESSLEGMNPNIAQPYTESWNFGIQRAVGKNNAIEVRYIGNRGIHQWMPLNLNEVNIFENGFLGEFQKAQAALTASGGTSFQGPAGSTPILDAAFQGNTAGGYSDGGFITNLQHGQVGTMANGIAQPFGDTGEYFCNLTQFAPCAANIGYTGPGGPYPSNLFQVNPYQAGSTVGYLTSAGYSNYNALEVEFRQQNWHGMHFTGNWTWSRSFAMNTQYTMRNLRLAYGPSPSDIHHVIHVIGTYDLPFGRGKAFLNRNLWLDRAVGGWTLGTTDVFQSGAPFQITGGNQTFNNLFDGGINLTGVTAKQLQHAMHFSPVPGNPDAEYWINPRYITAGVGVNSAFLSPNSTPGSVGTRYWFWGNHSFIPNSNLSITKRIPITQRVKFSMQAEMLDVFNHPVWGIGDTGAQDASFGETFGKGGGSRFVEIRGNIEF
jgi:Carboxypeptidase regulatory-like domain